MDLSRIEDAIEAREAVLGQMGIMTEAFKSALASDDDTDLLRIMTAAARRVTCAQVAVCGSIDPPDKFQVDASSHASDKGPSSVTSESQILSWLEFATRRKNDKTLRYSREHLLSDESKFMATAGLAVPDGLLAVRLTDPGRSDIQRILMVLNKDSGHFSVEDQAMLDHIGSFISLMRQPADARNRGSIDQRLLELVGEIPGLVARLPQRERKYTNPLEVSNRKLKNKMEENAASLYMTVKALEDEIEERRRIENKLRISQRQQRHLVQKTVESLENERRAIAKELHDSIGASLAAIKFSIEQTFAKMGQKQPEASESLKKMLGYLFDTIKETKRISANLRPATLDELGLLSTIQWFCRKTGEMYRDTHISQEIDIEEETIPDALKIVIYRVLQEAVTNALKHGAAENIKVVLMRKDTDIVLSVTDDGLGFEQHKQLKKDPLSGHGVQGMRERVEICGGRLRLSSTPGEGTRLLALVPYRLPRQDLKTGPDGEVGSPAFWK